MKRFDKHIFICENQRDALNPRGCCADKGSKELRQVFKRKLKEQNLSVRIRANAAGCLDACEYGAVIVVYPEQVWYGGVTIADVDDIITDHIMNDVPVERLKIKDKKFNKDGN
ncbi:MAG: (2Fe-2S) ferredoxin domain-containing protein [Ignavibacteriae bacterium]|nr:(2Fe-2S) ferredoxin domain-containing protein [Ignavibacteriota bacterium]NOG97360.1 (2Fe-2S) ferredoxin domain-containing protein [Ignavibacteriota bacterium]